MLCLILLFTFAFVFKTECIMENYKDPSGMAARCLECGNRLEYGRSDRKFCCDTCKNKYHNRGKTNHKAGKLKVMNAIDRNFRVLDNLLKLNISTIPLSDAACLGFNPAFVTSHAKNGRHMEYCCYDIAFSLSETKIFNIRRLSLNLYFK